MATFDFPYYLWDVKYPDEGTRVQFGSSYTFASAPSGPSQRLFTLELSGMQWFDNEVDEYDRNLNRLNTFYIDHKLHTDFTLVHPALGSMTVRFNKPLHIPKGIPGGGGVVGTLTLELVEQP